MSVVNPYTPPMNDEDVAPPSRAAESLPAEYRPSDGIAMALRVVLGVTILALLVDAVLMWEQIDLLSRMRSGGAWSMPEAEASDRRVLIGRVVYIALLLIAGTLWAGWQNLTHKNAQALGADIMEFGPNAWGWFVCPVINLWRPLQVVRELWICSDPRNTQTMTPPAVFGLWWGAWITGSLLSRLAWHLLRDEAKDLDALINSSWADVGSSLALIVAGGAAIFVITAVQRRAASGLARIG